MPLRESCRRKRWRTRDLFSFYFSLKDFFEYTKSLSVSQFGLERAAHLQPSCSVEGESHISFLLLYGENSIIH